MKSYFTIKEFCYSAKAEENKIKNIPNEEIKQHIIQMIDFLNPLREKWGSPITISSGYRCPELNTLVKGSKTSSHIIGFGADLVPNNGKMKEFKKFCANWIKDKDFDQCILEKSSKSEGVHIGLYNMEGEQRKTVFKLDVE